MKELKKTLRAFQWDLLKLFFKTVILTVITTLLIGVICFHQNLLDTPAPQVLGIANGLFLFFQYIHPRSKAIVVKHTPLITKEVERIQKEQEEKLREDKKS